MLLDHPRVGVSHVLSDNEEGSAVHDGMGGPGMAQLVKSDRLDLRPLAGGFHGLRLMIGAPGRTIGLDEYQVPRGATGAHLPEEQNALIGQCDGEYSLSAAALPG